MKKLFIIVIIGGLFVACKDDDKEQNQNVPVSNVKLNQNMTTRVLGDSFTLNASISPNDATNKNIAWSSSKTTVATVSNGIVSTLTPGTTNIIASTVDGGKTDICVLTVAQGCNLETPGWGSSLGAVSFASTQTWIIGSQTWSDVVQTTNCSNRNTFNGRNGTNRTYNADCRSNPDRKGDLFSWCAIVRFQDQLCPNTWRVPTREDFRNLDIALGGSGSNRNSTSQFVTENYINRWGGAFGGYCDSSGSLFYRTTSAGYWAQTEDDESHGYGLLISTVGVVNPQNWSRKFNGYTLRCVR